MTDHEKDIENLRLQIDILTAERDEARRDAERWQADALRLLTERNAAKEQNVKLLSKIQEYEAREQ
jgi:hypothetical protein